MPVLHGVHELPVLAPPDECFPTLHDEHPPLLFHCPAAHVI
jgi:hypothetical protein